MAISMKAARVNVGLTQSEVAKILNISKNTLVGYEKGRVMPPIDVAQKMARLYDQSVDDIIFLPNNLA